MVHDEAPAMPTRVANAPAGLPRLYTLEEVAEATGLSLRRLQNGARANAFEHKRSGRKRYMTIEQIHKMLDEATVRPVEDDEIAQELARRSRGAVKRTSRRAA